MNEPAELPYFDTVLEMLEYGNADFETAFGRHVHWGYWKKPELADGSFTDFAKAAQDMCDEIFALAQIESGQRLLDVGCGFGGTIASLNDHYSDIDLVGLNIDNRQLDRARRLITPASGNRIDFVLGNACELPFPDQSFDRLLAVECIFHFPSRRQFLSEARRVLKPGGRLFISDIVPTRLLVSLKGMVQPLLAPALSKTFGEMDNECTVADYMELTKEYGFVNASINDITKQTLPTHPVMRSLHKINAPEVYRRQLIQELAVQFLSTTGLLRYVLMTWRADSPS
jgi:ubiquinone/menaquinone biosynthesis C-methylase UbiE